MVFRMTKLRRVTSVILCYYFLYFVWWCGICKSGIQCNMFFVVFRRREHKINYTGFVLIFTNFVVLLLKISLLLLLS